MSAADWLRLVTEHAAELRAAGVVEVAVDGSSVKLAPPDPVIRVEGDFEQPTAPRDDFDDPITYGLPPGAPVPNRFRRRAGAESDQ